MSDLPKGPVRRPRRGWRRAEYASLDFETTGLDLGRDTVVSFGVVPVRGGRVVVGEAVHQLVRPHLPPSPRSQTIHELRPMDLEDAPPLRDARETLRQALRGRYLLVWFADVELNFLMSIFAGPRRAWRRRMIDVRNLAIAVDGQPAAVRKQHGYALASEAERRGVPVASPHDALDDAFVTAQLFVVLARKLPGRPDPTVSELLRAASPLPARVERRFSRGI
ncbi:MAG: 3'-5' exonuclease [Actinobacteria bacterium]|nr:3'-5' exonuclease [Actinomycetota bacterium]